MAFPKRTTAPAFQFYASDFLSSDKVSRMGAAERGCYITLLCHAWLANGLPNDHAQIARYLSLSPARFKKLWAGPLGECFIVKSGRLVNPRQERIRADLAAFVKRQRENGRLGGRPPKPTQNPDETQTLPTTKPKRKPRQSQTKALQSSVFSLQSSKEKDLAPSALTAAPSADAKPHPIKDFLRLHEELFEARFRQKPAKYTGKDAKIAQRVLDRYGPDEAARLLRSFMDADDDFMDRAGFGLNVFESQINKLVTAKQPAPPVASWRDACRQVGHSPECNSFDQHRLREIVTARGCTHPGVCRSHGEHAQRIADEQKAVAS